MWGRNKIALLNKLLGALHTVQYRNYIYKQNIKIEAIVIKPAGPKKVGM